MPDPRAARPLALDATVVMITAKGELWSEANLVVAAALLVDLRRRDRLEVVGSGQQLEVSVRDTTPVGDELLDEALQVLAAGGRSQRVTKVVTRLPKSDRVLERLLAEGAVSVESKRKLGIRTVERHHPTPAAGRDALMTTMRGAYLGTATPDDRSALLLSVLAIGRALRAGVPADRRPEVLRRILAVRESIGEDEAALVSTIDEVVRRANNSTSQVGPL